LDIEVVPPWYLATNPERKAAAGSEEVLASCGPLVEFVVVWGPSYRFTKPVRKDAAAASALLAW